MVALLFDHFGPYHRSRLKGAMSQMDCTGVEFFRSSKDYSWEVLENHELPIVTVGDESLRERSSHRIFSQRLSAVLQSIDPDAVAIPGWASPAALSALDWCWENDVPAIVMSESSKIDFERHPLKEWVKKQILSLFSSALVGGSSHQEYLSALGMPLSRIHLGYDAVDNAYFEQRSSPRVTGDTPSFLASARFIEKKNLIRLLRAYSDYRSKLTPSQTPWDLVLLGDGEMRPQIEAEIRNLHLAKSVTLPGFKQYEELPAYYAKASAFIHASTTEQWGLVVNEAMASGLPVLVSNTCGCAHDLVKTDVNGFTFDPTDIGQMAEAMLTIAQKSDRELREMGDASRKIIAQWGPERFGMGLRSAMESALASPRPNAGPLKKFLLNLLNRS